MPCPFLQIGFGNVLEEPFSEIRKRAICYPVYSGYPNRCLGADNYDFIDDCLKYTFSEERLSIFHEHIPVMKCYDKNGNKSSWSSLMKKTYKEKGLLHVQTSWRNCTGSFLEPYEWATLPRSSGSRGICCPKEFYQKYGGYLDSLKIAADFYLVLTR